MLLCILCFYMKSNQTSFFTFPNFGRPDFCLHFCLESPSKFHFLQRRSLHTFTILKYANQSTHKLYTTQNTKCFWSYFFFSLKSELCSKQVCIVK
eukprot:UN07404